MLLGEDILFESTLNSNSNFKDIYISLTSEKVFLRIQKNIDLLVEMQEKLGNSFSALENVGINEAFVQKISKEIEIQKNNIKETFLSTQNLILTSYFDNSLNLAYTSKSLENYRNKLYLFKNLIAYSDNTNFYNQYYIDKMMEIEKKYNFDPLKITALTIVKPSFISKLIQKLKLLFGLNKEYVKVR